MDNILYLAAPALLLSLLSVSGLVASDWNQFKPGRFVCKPLAALAFIWLALALGGPGSNYGYWLVGGLLLCALGDILLMFESQGSFLAGLVAFLCGHLFYVVAFSQLPMHLSAMAISMLPALILLAATLRWLKPYLHWPMKAAVPVYILVITAMLVFAAGTSGQPGALVIIVGAWGFAFSDLAVARRQFVNPERLNGLWGTPLYFASQMLLAASLGWQHGAG